MRARTLLAGATLALLTAVWSAPTALAAAPNADPPPSDSGSSSSGVAPPALDAKQQQELIQEQLRKQQELLRQQQLLQQQQLQQQQLQQQQQQSQQQQQPQLPLQQQQQLPLPQQQLQQQQQQQFQQQLQQQQRDAAQKQLEDAQKKLNVPQLPGSGPQAFLAAPGQVFADDVFNVQGNCANSSKNELTFTGPASGQNSVFKVNSDARSGDKIVFTLVCSDPADAKATKVETIHVLEKRGHGPGGDDVFLHLDPNSGQRGDDVDVRAYCPHGGGGRLESDGLDDIRLHHDGEYLRGETHVEKDADFGRTTGRLICDDGSRDWDRFYIERDDHDRYLDVDPGHGHRGDEVQVRVHCDRDLKKLDSDGALDDVDLDRDGDHWWRYSDTGHVAKDADYGEHTIRIKCGDDWLEDDFFVQHDGDKGDGGSQSGLYPEGGVETGGGPLDGGPPFGAIALGLTGVLGAALAGAGATLERRGARR